MLKDVIEIGAFGVSGESGVLNVLVGVLCGLDCELTWKLMG